MRISDWSSDVCSSDLPGKSWLKILKEEGFEFLRTVANSVYSGSSVIESATDGANKSYHKTYHFGLFRNIGMSYVGNPSQAPPEWMKLDQVVPKACKILTKAARKRCNQNTKESR